jgi:hypothetical protein
MNSAEQQLFDALHEIMGLDPAEQSAYPPPYLFKINDEPVTIELQDVVTMYLPEDAPEELKASLGYDEDSIPTENYRILLSAEIDIPSSVTNFETAYREILKLNYFGLATGGCTFGLDPENNFQVQIHYLVPFSLNDIPNPMLHALIAAFISKVIFCRQIFDQIKTLGSNINQPKIMPQLHRQKFI